MSANRHVVYTVATGSFGISEDAFPCNTMGFDKICFTDNPDLRSETWKIVLMEPGGLDPQRESRRPKILPHKYLPNYEYSLYVDSSLQFLTSPETIFSLYATPDRPSLQAFAHPRNCTYEEAEAVIRLGFDAEVRVREQMDFYEAAGFPRQAGLITGTMLLRRHNEPDLIRLSEAWFEQILRFSRRDQLSLDFVAWRNHFTYGHLPGSIDDNLFVNWRRGDQARIPANFDERYYVWMHPEVLNSGLSPREHYLKIGQPKHLTFAPPVDFLTTLANRYHSDKGTIYFNAHGYAEVYAHYLAPLRTMPFRLLELGLLRHDVQARNPGGPYDEAPSLSMWRDYCPNAEIFGFDIADFSAYPCPNGVKIFRGDMGAPSDLESMLQETGTPLDIIIDDASHASHHQQIALKTLFPYLTAGGYYIIEDLHYQPSSLEPKGVTKTLEVLRMLANRRPVFSSYISQDDLKALASDIEYIHFYDSQDRKFGLNGTDAIAVIKKKGRAAVKSTPTVTE